MPEYRFSEKERDMCDSLAQIWTLAENKNLHFKDVKEAEKPEILSELIEKQRQVSGKPAGFLDASAGSGWNLP